MPDSSQPALSSIVKRGEDPVEEAWQRVLGAWDDDDAHRAFLGVCTNAGRLPEAGKRYRAVKLAGGARAERADAQINKLLTLGMTLMAQQRTPPPKPRNRPLSILIFVAIFLIGLSVAIYVMGT